MAENIEKKSAGDYNEEFASIMREIDGVVIGKNALNEINRELSVMKVNEKIITVKELAERMNEEHKKHGIVRVATYNPTTKEMLKSKSTHWGVFIPMEEQTGDVSDEQSAEGEEETEDEI